MPELAILQQFLPNLKDFTRILVQDKAEIDSYFYHPPVAIVNVFLMGNWIKYPKIKEKCLSPIFETHHPEHPFHYFLKLELQALQTNFPL